MNENSSALGPYIQAHRSRAVSGFLLVLGSVALGVATPFILRFAIDDLSGDAMTRPKLFFYASLYVLASVAGGAFALWMRRVMLKLGYQVESEIRRDLFLRLTKLDSGFYRRQRTGDIMTKMSSDLQSIREFIGQGLLQGSRTLIGFVLAFSVMFAINVRLAFFMLLLLPAISVIFFSLLRAMRRRYEKVQEHYSAITNFAQECFSGIRLIKGFGIEPRQRGMFQDLNREYIRRHLRLSAIERPVWPLMAFLFSIGVVLLIVVGGRQVVHGQLTLGEFVQFNQYLFYLQWPMLALGWTANLLQRGHTSWKRVRTILDAEPAIRDGDSTDGSLRTVGGDIVFRNVVLRLDGQTVLDRIALEIPEGTTVGITGPTASGKTQLVSLIARLVDPTLGEVRMGGRDVREYPLEVLRKHIGMAPQEPFLFSDTLAYNIAFGLPDAYEEKILWAADVAQLRTEVEMFPRGFQTVLGERGVTLSGGQRQRAAISRAIARHPRILILDDVFSAIDTQTESRIIQQLTPVLRGRTSFIISHRVSTLRETDFVVVLERGHVTQVGKHAELVQRPGYYRDLDESQRLEARLEAG